MINQPFTLLRPFEKKLSVSLFTKEDGLITDQSIASSMGSPDYAALDQVHGSKVIRVKSPMHRTEKADGMITDQSNLSLMIRIADCQPLIIYVPDANVVGLLHGGWKGLVAGAIPQMMRMLSNTFQIQPASCLVGIGPCLCKHCAEFTNPLLELDGIPPDLVSGRKADLRTWADRQLVECGIVPNHIERMMDCTRCHPEKYWTYRGGDRDEVQRGRTNVMACVLAE